MQGRLTLEKSGSGCCVEWTGAEVSPESGPGHQGGGGCSVLVSCHGDLEQGCGGELG